MLCERGLRISMDVFQVDDEGRLFIAPDIDDWHPLNEHGINVVFDLDGDPDVGVPSVPNQLIYIFYPIEDGGLPDLTKLHEIALLGANLVRSGATVLSHCGMGHNRSALLAGVIMTYLGMSGREAVARLRDRRRGALYNHVFASYLDSLPGLPRDGALGQAFAALAESQPVRAA
jgi:protein-tyrosine phosphatase